MPGRRVGVASRSVVVDAVAADDDDVDFAVAVNAAD